MDDRYRRLHLLLASLGHASRFRIALRLLEHERSVGELALAIGLSQSCTTRHVQALERAGIVRSRRDGKRVRVGIDLDQADLAGLLDWLGPRAGEPNAGPESGHRGEPHPNRSAEPADGGVASERPKLRKARVARPTPRPRPTRSTDAIQEEAPSGPPASGTHPAPVEAGERQPRRARDSIEDFLL